MQQPISLARWGHYGVPVLVFPTAGGDAEEIERHHLLGSPDGLDRGRAGSRSTPATASPGRAMTADDGSVEYRCWLFNQFQQAIAHEVVPAIHATPAGPQEVIVAGASIGAFNALALICRWPAPVPVGGLHERHLRHRAVHRRIHRRTCSSPRPCTSCPGWRGRPGPAPRAVRLPAVGIGRTGRTSASPGGPPRSSAPRACPTGSTTGAPTTTTTGRPGGRCCRLRPASTVITIVGAIAQRGPGRPAEMCPNLASAFGPTQSALPIVDR